MSAERAGAATPRADLERQVMDSNFPKNEREWWAAREIGNLRTALKSIAANTCCTGCQEAALVARNALSAVGGREVAATRTEFA